MVQRTIVDWEGRKAGENTELWDGKDSGGNLVDKDKMVIKLGTRPIQSEVLSSCVWTPDGKEEKHIDHRHESHDQKKCKEIKLKLIKPTPMEKISGDTNITIEVDPERCGYGQTTGHGMRVYIDDERVQEEYFTHTGTLEEERFLDILKNRKDAERAYMLYHLMLITGLRLSETLSLNVEHTNRTKVEIKVKGWTKNRTEGRGLASNSQSQGEKKDRFKTVYFPKALQRHLKEYLKVKAKRGESLLLEAPLFVSRNSTRISPRQVQRDFKKWVKESGIESNLSPHALRHTVGTRLLKEFKNAKLVQRYLGHSDVATTLRYYVDVFPEDLEEAAEMLAQ